MVGLWPQFDIFKERLWVIAKDAIADGLIFVRVSILQQIVNSAFEVLI